MKAGWRAGLLANALVLAPLALAAVLHETWPALYQRSVQEDEPLEWTTFWAFAVAAGLFARSALGAMRDRERTAWFLGGLALFCVFVGGEEISWGQRLFAYRPPAYFLEHNFQQELNLHNVVDTDLRKAAFLVVTAGYGVVLPLLLLLPIVRRLGERLGIAGPSHFLIPGFAATASIYADYPWSHTGEWAEAMLGLGFLGAAAMGGDRSSLARVVAAGGSVFALGFATAALWWTLSGSDPERSAVAAVEVQALAEDFAKARTRTRCGLHKRVYSAARKYRYDHLKEGAFASLASKGLPEARASFFLDPWNSPYWIRHECSRDRRRRAIFVYSFGPNRIRDSNDWEIRPDDIGEWISRPAATSGLESDPLE